MSQQDYEHLIREWARQTGAADVEGMVRHGRVRVRDTVVELVYHYDAYEPLVLLVGYFGKLPADDGGATAQAFLHANFTLQVLGHSLCWSANPRTGQIIAHGRLPLHSLDPQGLNQCLLAFAELAEVWHTSADEACLHSHQAPLVLHS